MPGFAGLNLFIMTVEKLLRNRLSFHERIARSANDLQNSAGKNTIAYQEAEIMKVKAEAAITEIHVLLNAFTLKIFLES